MTIVQKPFYFMRHGEADWNKQRRVMGQKDIPLNATGLTQAKTVAETIQPFTIQTIISSPLKRALTTAQIIAEKMNQEVIIESHLQECCWGMMEGKEKEDCSYQGIPFEPERWWREGIVPDGTESFKIFSQRVTKAINIHLNQYPSILFVAHGGVGMAILSAISQPVWSIAHTTLYTLFQRKMLGV